MTVNYDFESSKKIIIINVDGFFFLCEIFVGTFQNVLQAYCILHIQVKHLFFFILNPSILLNIILMLSYLKYTNVWLI